MKHKTWFRLVLKAIGVLMLCLGLPELIGLTLHIGYVMSVDNPPMFGQSAWGIISHYYAQIISYLLQSAAGLYLLFGGKWLVDKVIPSNQPYCPNCGYPLTENAHSRCPECGVALPTAAVDSDTTEQK